MNEPGLSSLMDQETFARRAETAPGWVQDHWETFERGLTGTRDGVPASDASGGSSDAGASDGVPFPCFFGAESVRAGEPLYTVVPSMDLRADLRQLGAVLQEYLAVHEDHGERASLVAFFRPPERPLSEREWHETLWHVLQFLHVHDPEPWPADIPTDPDDPEWEFSYAGVPMFPTCRAPFYRKRPSRYCPVGLEITFQPRRLFENLNVTADHPQGQQAREIIQRRLESYDGHPPHHLLGDWGVEGDREWPQYMLPEDETQAPDTCPMTVTRDHPKSSFRAAGD